MTDTNKTNFKPNESVIELQNKVMAVLKASTEQLISSLETLTPKQITEYLESVEREVTLYGTFPVMIDGEIQNGMKVNVLRDNRSNIYDHFRNLGYSLGRKNSDISFLTMIYLEMLSNQPLSMDAINKAEALAKYEEIKKSVKQIEQQYSL